MARIDICQFVACPPEFSGDYDGADRPAGDRPGGPQGCHRRLGRQEFESIQEDTVATESNPTAIDLDAEYEAAIERAMNRVRDPAAMERAAREMDEGREEIRSRLGEIEMAVELIRDVRDE